MTQIMWPSIGKRKFTIYSVDPERKMSCDHRKEILSLFGLIYSFGTRND